ncbi:MAG TPA: tetratricopeptide repeat protein [Ignavibacteriaceae bacterium]
MHFKRFIPGSFILLILSAGLASEGCSVWQNFTTYFNVYYDAKDIFEDAETAIQSQRKDIFSTDEPVAAGNVNQQLSKVIDKCSTILQFHSGSSYVDDALLMLGKSFYYQKNYLKAERKFQELIATRPESDLILETELWIGKTQMRLKKYDDGLAMLETVKNKSIEEGEDDFITEAFLEEIKYKIAQEDYAGAITASNDYLKQSDDDEINAEIEFELGKLYREVNDLENAITSFRKVFDYSPSYDTQYAATLELGKALREAGHNDQALEVFDEMSKEDKYSDHYDEINLEKGKSLASLNQFDEAVGVLIKVDTTYKSSVNAGVARYELGQIFETHYQNFDSANTYYTRASASVAPPEYLTKAHQKAQLFKKYLELRNTLKNNQEKSYYAEHPDQYSSDSLSYYQERKDIEEQVIAEQEFAEVKAKMDSALFVQDTTGLKVDTTVVQRDRLDQFGHQVFDTFGKKITVTDTVIVNPLDSLKAKNQMLSSITSPNFEKRVKELMHGKEPPLKPDLSLDSLQSLVVKEKFELGNLYFTEFNLPDSAYMHYTDILSSNPGPQYTARTLYALGSYYLTKNDSVRADSLFNVIYTQYPEQGIVNAAANKLGKPLLDLNYDPAENLYASAEKEMNNDRFDSSLVKFKTIYNEYPNSPLAPKALYASGWILENKLDKVDSAAALYDTLKLKYPATVYANKISQKLSVYNLEQTRLAKALEDSLKKMEALKPDSLAKADTLKNKSVTGDSLKSVNNIPPTKISEPDVNAGNESPDSLKNGTPGNMDEMRRIRNRELEELRKRSENKADTLNQGEIKRRK